MSDNVIRLAIVGKTGAGKTSFLNMASGVNMQIGHTGSSCTDEVQQATVQVRGRQVVLYDTPGFDDSRGEDGEILLEMGKWLAHSYDTGIRLNGVIFMQPINDVRVGDSEGKRTRVISKIVGDDAYSHITIVSSLWDNVNEEFGEKCENNRKVPGGVWSEMLAGGADLMRYLNDRRSALAILDHIVLNVDKFFPFGLQLQQELVAHNGELLKTSAAKEFDDGLSRTLSTLIQFKNKTPAMEAKVEKIQSWRRRLFNTFIKIGNVIAESIPRYADLISLASTIGKCAMM